MPKQQVVGERNWYVIHTYSGYEDAVTRNLKQRIESLGMEDKIDSWYVVRNTPNVTGFVGSGTTPIPVSNEEIQYLQNRMGVESPHYEIEAEPGDNVKIIDGPFKDFDGRVSEIDKERGKIKVLVNMFGRDTPVELDSLQIQKL